MPVDDPTVFRALLDESQDNILVVDRELRYTHVSRGAAAAVGMTPAQLEGRTWRELGFPAEEMETIEPAWRRAFDTGLPTRGEIEYETVAGARFFEYVTFPVRAHGEIVAVAMISRDVTPRTVAERMLARSEERYRSLISHSSEGIWRFELEEPLDVSLPPEEQLTLILERAYLAECNDVVARMYGYESAEEIVGARLTQMLDPAEPANREYVLAFIHSGYRLSDAESIEVDRFGRRKYFLNTLHGIVEDGQLRRAWGMQRDVTEQKAWVERLRLSEERLQALVEASSQVVWTTDPEGRLDWITPSWTELTGQQTNEAKGWGWTRFLHPDDREAAERAWREAVSTRSRYRNTSRVLTRDGTYRWFQMRAAPVLNDDGSLREWVGACNDVDAERRQEEMLASDQVRAQFIASANDLFVRSLDYEETLRNLARLCVPRLADWCAVDMVEQGNLRRLAVEHVDPSKVELAYELQDRYPTDMSAPYGAPQVIRTGRTEFVPQIPEELLTSAARSPEHLEVIRRLQLHSYICTPIRVREKVEGVLTLVMAESERTFTARDVELAEALALRAGHAIENARLYQQALEANRAKDDFLATLSHELRTPLTAILGWANLLRLSNYDRETLRAAVDTIERSARTQATIIDDLLDVSRIIRGKFQINPEEVDAVGIVRSVVASSHPAAEGKRLTLRVDAPPTLVLRADPNRLQQIVWNLLSNAIKFSAEGGTIEVTLEQQDDDAVLRVVDHGIGIPPEVLPRVFDRFWQAESSSNRVHGGLGLGLAIVKHLAEMHGGTVEARSEGAGQGATFTVTLPIAARDVQRPDSRRSPAIPLQRVLVVDDDEGAREVIARMLEHYGAEVTEASSATTALELAISRPFDLVLTDLAMPGHDGYWLLDRLRSDRPELRVAAITAYGVAEDEVAAAGFDAFVRKPVDPVRLEQLLAAE